MDHLTVYYYKSNDSSLWAASTRKHFPDNETGVGQTEDEAFLDLLNKLGKQHPNNNQKD